VKKKENWNKVLVTSMAVVRVFATIPGSACHVPNPTEGILAPVFNSKN